MKGRFMFTVATDQGKWVVPAEDTITPGLLVTVTPGAEKDLTLADINTCPVWNVSHEGSGLKIFGRAPIEIARLMAGAYGGLPVDWSVEDLEELKNQITVLPVLYQTWLKSSTRKVRGPRGAR